MSLHDCHKCGELICVCGWDYRGWSEKDLSDQITMLQKVLRDRINAKEQSDEPKTEV